VRAAATPYRERSHFDGQDVLESGFERPGRADSGWLNRALASLEPDTHNPRGGNIFAVGPTTPLVVRGAAPVMLWTLAPAPVDTVTRVLDLYRHTDLALARVLEDRIGLAAIAQENGMEPKLPGGNQQRRPIQELVRSYFAEAAATTAKYLASPEGPRIGALAFNGWDTHINERCPRHARFSVRGPRWRQWGDEEQSRPRLARDCDRAPHRVRSHGAY